MKQTHTSLLQAQEKTGVVCMYETANSSEPTVSFTVANHKHANTAVAELTYAESNNIQSSREIALVDEIVISQKITQVVSTTIVI